MESRGAAEKTREPSDEARRLQGAIAEFVEARLRQLVAQQLGVDPTQLATESSLAEDLAADEVDLLEIAVALEEEFGLVVSDAVLSKVQTYGDLSAAVTGLLAELAESDVSGVPPGIVRVRVIRPEGSLLHSGRLTPRAIERLVEDALSTAGVTRLELACSENTSDHQLARIAQRLAWLRTRAIEVTVRRLQSDTDKVSATVQATCEAAPRSVPA